MSQSYHLLNSSLRSSNTPQSVPIGADPQATAGENPYAERSRISDETQDWSTGTGNPVLLPQGENETWPQDAQDEWIPGFRGRDPETRRDALNRYLQTPQYTYESIVREFWLQQTQSLHEAQRKATEKEAMERERRKLAEQHRQIARADGQGLQPRRF